MGDQDSKHHETGPTSLDTGLTFPIPLLGIDGTREYGSNFASHQHAAPIEAVGIRRFSDGRTADPAITVGGANHEARLSHGRRLEIHLLRRVSGIQKDFGV